MAACAGVQNVSRPIERCQEMSQMMPTLALVAATSVAATYQGRCAASGGDRVPGGPPPSSDHLSPEPPATSPLPRHFSKIFLTCWCASSNACLAVIRPVAALANIVGRTKVSNTSLSAGFAGPGCRMLVAHCKAVLTGLSLEGGFEPNGSFAVTCSSHLLPEAIFCATGAPGSATEPVKDGKLYSLLPRTASR